MFSTSDQVSKMNSRILSALLILGIATCVIAGGFCPKSRHPQCNLSYKINDCCAQSDCRVGSVCCVEGCGNVCRAESDTPLGEKFVDGSECKHGHVFPKKWYQFR
uniref:U20-lycotoxin-Ls1d n=1 Tax=Lycosa singoriensis TaxID=434756 RepID=TXK04_LYCSI|nr:RecName: Full=U20-lycotoxin-Ls1d; AltName: Full=Toxin-like structure LSTX-Q4; Flags: Precursor [Lycosa singoriensis]ACI41397.1 toxin-like structure LSTX-Q4 precursor [Lycosa singoriensis]CAS03666.1 toxin-like structure LSTX-Q4 precursor [Lycosa singoriensis]